MEGFLIVAVALLAVFAVRFRSDARRLSNAVLLLAGLGAFGLWLLSLISELLASTIMVFAPPLSALVLAAVLIANGVVMLRREGRRPANALSLAAGVGIVVLMAGVAATFVAAYREQSEEIFLPALSLLLVSGYVGLVFVLVLLYAFVYGRVNPPPGHAAIIILGAGVPDGRVRPLLAARLDRAVSLYRAETAAGYAPLLVPSGGQGADEPLPEARAMAGYLRERGIACAALLEEDRSTSTRENLLLSTALLAECGVAGRLLVVTSNYHALRAALQARRLRIPAQVRGARTAWYYLPNAFLREFVAILAEYKLLHTIMIVLIAASPLLLYLASG